MHLLAAKPGGFNDDEGIIDLAQTPGDIVILSAQDTSLGLLAQSIEELPEDYPEVRLANLMHLSKPAAFDLYEHCVLRYAKLIIVSVLGGLSYWEYGIDQLQQLVLRTGASLVLVPGDDQPDSELRERSNCTDQSLLRIWKYLRFGGLRNASNLFAYIRAELIDPISSGIAWQEPRAFPSCIIYRKNEEFLDFVNWNASRNPDLPVAVLLFYRTHVQSGNTQAFDHFIELLGHRFNVLPLAVASLKDQHCQQLVNNLLERAAGNIIINTTSFSQHIEGNAALSSVPQLIPRNPFTVDIPVIQAILAASDEEDWEQNLQGLRARDIAMNISLPEFDGRIISRAISFKTTEFRSERSQIDVIRYRLHEERAQFVVQLARSWANLSVKPAAEKSIALILANYPTRDGRIGNGVGLDTPASTINLLQRLQEDGYDIKDIPEDGDTLINILLQQVTNDLDRIPLLPALQSLDLETYLEFFNSLPKNNQKAVLDRWGKVEADPKFRRGRIIISGVRLGSVFVGIQPARGFNIDHQANYHDPDLVPPHGYLAFYCWLRKIYNVDAIVHVGKHGNLEWLPGKSVALANTCWPDIAMGPVPHFYPFIVNDPGEGAQAKRRTQAVVLDHLMPPMARAESYGQMQELERLVDEYYEAISLDPRREKILKQQIVKLLADSNLAEEIGLPTNSTAEEMLNEVDSYLCELKEAQIRNGLHRFGQTPGTDKLAETLVALVRLPRGDQPGDQGLLHALAKDLDLKCNDQELFNPLEMDAARKWSGNRPEMLKKISADSWHTEGDTRERLELLGLSFMQALVDGTPFVEDLPSTTLLIQVIEQQIFPAVIESGAFELGFFSKGLSGKHVPAGPSGAPTRGRLDVLPTGRNFYSLDSRSIPTRTAYQLGQLSSEQVISRYLQDHGEYPEHIGLSVWGTSTMRTGGDDIAQAFALMGVRPIWSQGSNRVVDIEIIPGFQLGRPRVDVTLRISGFFRDAFPNVVRLFDTAVQALACYEEPGDSNTIRRHVLAEVNALEDSGFSSAEAQIRAALRVFGSKPGSYGAGLQGLIDEGIWDNAADLAKAYVNWGGYSYSNDKFGEANFLAFENRLSKTQVVVQNQDNREHDLLDSDDYYQFQGGMSNAVEVISGEQPTVYHGDHSNPSNPKIRTLKEELNRVIRSRVVNPKWIAAMREHGYKGAFEMAATVDYLFAYDATTNFVDDYQYEAVTDAFVLDKENREFLQQSNRDALKEISARLIEAQQRGLWQNPGDYEEKLGDILVDVDNRLESRE